MVGRTFELARVPLVPLASGCQRSDTLVDPRGRRIIIIVIIIINIVIRARDMASPFCSHLGSASTISSLSQSRCAWPNRHGWPLWRPCASATDRWRFARPGNGMKQQRILCVWPLLPKLVSTCRSTRWKCSSPAFERWCAGGKTQALRWS